MTKLRIIEPRQITGKPQYYRGYLGYLVSGHLVPGSLIPCCECHEHFGRRAAINCARQALEKRTNSKALRVRNKELEEKVKVLERGIRELEEKINILKSGNETE